MKNWLKNNYCYHCWFGRWMPIDWSFRSYWWPMLRKGEYRSVITLASPLINTLLYWKYRNYDLKIPDIKND